MKFGETEGRGRSSTRARSGSLTIDVATRRALLRGRDLGLSDLSFDVLAALMAAWPQPVTSDELIKRAWGGVYVGADTVKQRIRTLRVQLGGPRESVIRTVRGRGYRLAETVTWEGEASRRRAARRTTLQASRIAAALVAGIGLGIGLSEVGTPDAPATTYVVEGPSLPSLDRVSAELASLDAELTTLDVFLRDATPAGGGAQRR